jgi:hypothetical protein
VLLIVILQLPPAAPALVRHQSSVSAIRDAISAIIGDAESLTSISTSSASSDSASASPKAAAAALQTSRTVLKALHILLKRAMLNVNAVKQNVLRQYLLQAQAAAERLGTQSLEEEVEIDDMCTPSHAQRVDES